MKTAPNILGESELVTIKLKEIQRSIIIGTLHHRISSGPGSLCSWTLEARFYDSDSEKVKTCDDSWILDSCAEDPLVTLTLSNKCIATRNKCLTTSNKKLLGTSASLLVTRSY